ncbi:MAG: hypothetical protein PGN33_13300 [Methylobacterium radiotolerans]
MDDAYAARLRARCGIHQTQALILHNIHLFGDELGEKQGYGVRGLEAVALFLLQRDGTPPERTLLYKIDHLGLLLAKEIRGWKSPEDAVDLTGNSIEAWRWRQIEADAILDYSTVCFGDALGQREDLGGLEGEEALRFYLVQKHNWHPADVSVLSVQALRDLLKVEMRGWTMTDQQIAATKPE